MQGTSATVNWTAPQEENGILTNYKVVFDGEHGVETNVPASELRAEVDDLCGPYEVTVTAQNGAGWGTPSDPEPAFIDTNGKQN